MNRRSFITSVGAALAPAAWQNPLVAQGSYEPLEDIVDCHFHLWAEDKKRFPYQPNPRYAPNYATTPAQWNRDRVGAGVSMGIFVSGAPYGDDPSYLYHCLKESPETIRGVCLINPNERNSVKNLETTVAGHKIVGVRLQTSWLWGIDWDSAYLQAFWKRLGELNLVAQVHLEPQWNPQLIKMVDREPGTKVVIDHLGRPRNGNGTDFMLFKEVAKRPHVHMKLSSFPSESNEGPPFQRVQPVVQGLVEWFTPKRCVWGGSYRGDMGSAAYLEQVNQARRLLDFLSLEDQRQIFCRTPDTLYELG
jgi:L-fuconolactonase